MCQKMEFARFLPVKFKDPKFILRIDMKHSYFSNYCLPSFSSIIKVIIELFVV